MSEEEHEEKDLFQSLIGSEVMDPENPIIVYDDREKSGVLDELRKKKCRLICAHLENGDYLVSSRTCFELKVGQDFASSTVLSSGDHNLWDQMYRLKQSVEYPNLIVQEMEKSYWLAKTHGKVEMLTGAFQSLRLKYPIHHTNSSEETANLIWNSAHYEQKEHHSGMSRSVPRNRSIKEKKSYLLQGLVGCGSKKAEDILSIYPSPLLFLIDLSQTELLYTKSGKPKGIGDPLSGKIKGLNFKFVQDNKELLI
jgi:ERCC4-type nuclease